MNENTFGEEEMEFILNSSPGTIATSTIKSLCLYYSYPTYRLKNNEKYKRYHLEVFKKNTILKA